MPSTTTLTVTIDPKHLLSDDLLNQTIQSIGDTITLNNEIFQHVSTTKTVLKIDDSTIINYQRIAVATLRRMQSHINSRKSHIINQYQSAKAQNIKYYNSVANIAYLNNLTTQNIQNLQEFYGLTDAEFAQTIPDQIAVLAVEQFQQMQLTNLQSRLIQALKQDDLATYNFIDINLKLDALTSYHYILQFELNASQQKITAKIKLAN